MPTLVYWWLLLGAVLFIGGVVTGLVPRFEVLLIWANALAVIVVIALSPLWPTFISGKTLPVLSIYFFFTFCFTAGGAVGDWLYKLKARGRNLALAE